MTWHNLPFYDTQVTADVFLIDWESSGKTQEDNRRVSSLANQLTARRLPPMETPASTFQEASKQPPSHPSPSSFPSVWRMYLVANEWNEVSVVPLGGSLLCHFSYFLAFLVFVNTSTNTMKIVKVNFIHKQPNQPQPTTNNYN